MYFSKYASNRSMWVNFSFNFIIFIQDQIHVFIEPNKLFFDKFPLEVKSVIGIRDLSILLNCLHFNILESYKLGIAYK